MYGIAFYEQKLHVYHKINFYEQKLHVYHLN